MEKSLNIVENICKTKYLSISTINLIIFPSVFLYFRSNAGCQRSSQECDVTDV